MAVPFPSLVEQLLPDVVYGLTGRCGQSTMQAWPVPPLGSHLLGTHCEYTHCQDFTNVYPIQKWMLWSL